MGITLTFHGAAECVTGFCAKLQTDQATVGTVAVLRVEGGVDGFGARRARGPQ